jgi:putative tryptophan/tyrosine transport system substrate-binding protein
MRRREFVMLFGGAATVMARLQPREARAQQNEGRVRRVGWLTGGTENGLGVQRQRTTMQEELAKLGWIDGRNLRFDVRFGAGDLDRTRAHAAELVRLASDVIVTSGGTATRVVQEQTQSIPIVFSSLGDPVAFGAVQNIARPEGNTTGFSTAEPSIAGKWLGLLKEAAPHVARVAVIFHPEQSATGPSYMAVIEAIAPALAVDVIKAPVRDAIDLVHAIDTFAAVPNGGVVALPPCFTAASLDAILRLAMRRRLPAIYSGGRDVVALGGLIAYGIRSSELARQAAVYVDRLLRGAKVAELPVQFPTKYELVVNLKTAKAIGLTIPSQFLLRADEAIE